MQDAVAKTPPAGPLATPEPWDLVADAYAVELVPQFELFANDALRLAALPAGARISTWPPVPAHWPCSRPRPVPQSVRSTSRQR